MICPTQTWKWWHIYVYAYGYVTILCPCCSASTTNQGSLVTLTFDRLTLIGATCDVGYIRYLCANFSLPRPLCSIEGAIFGAPCIGYYDGNCCGYRCTACRYTMATGVQVYNMHGCESEGTCSWYSVAVMVYQHSLPPFLSPSLSVQRRTVWCWSMSAIVSHQCYIVESLNWQRSIA